MGTEEDTFNRLKRVTFEEMNSIMQSKLFELHRLGVNGCFDFSKMYTDNGWTYSEFYNEKYQGIGNFNV